MNLANKPCYPINPYDLRTEIIEENQDRFGLTFRERLIIALASNGEMVKETYKYDITFRRHLIEQADLIIKEMKAK